jgi:hypothetical protein
MFFGAWHFFPKSIGLFLISSLHPPPPAGRHSRKTTHGPLELETGKQKGWGSMHASRFLHAVVNTKERIPQSGGKILPPFLGEK